MLWLIVAIPFSVVAIFFLIFTALYVYLDVEIRTKSRFVAAVVAIAVTLCYWPLSFLNYIVCTAVLDRENCKTKTIQS